MNLDNFDYVFDFQRNLVKYLCPFNQLKSNTLSGLINFKTFLLYFT